MFPADVSPTWKAVEHGLELLKKGLKWRIGDGRKVRIWKDQWIPRQSSLKLSPQNGRCRLRWVHQLINQDTNSWDADLIKNVCSPLDVNEILKIKLPHRGMEDFLAWHFDKTGVFTVRSAYHLALHNQLKANELGSSSSSTSGERKIWASLWTAPVPQKVKIFAWRLARECLATMENRKKRKLEIDSTCRICGLGGEDGFHAVISCTKATALRSLIREVWELPDERFLIRSGPDWLLIILDSINAESRAKFLLLLWRAWFLRNDSVHCSGKASVLGSLLFLQSLWESLFMSTSQGKVDDKGKKPVMQSRLSSPDSHERNHTTTMGWTPPPMGWVKANVDGSFIQSSEAASAGIVIRDHTGSVLLTSWRILSHCGSAEEAEATACWEGVNLAAEWVKKPLILETDCANLVSMLTSSGFDRAQLCHVLRSIKFLLQACLIFVCRRLEGNAIE